MEFITHCEEETIACGEEFGSRLLNKSVVCFFGDLGAGKTTFIKGIVKGCSSYPQAQVNSPTFVYLNIYQGTKIVYHFDLYRLKDSDEFLEFGFDEMFYGDGICLLEWSEKIKDLLPENMISVTIEALDESKRKITLG